MRVNTISRTLVTFSAIAAIGAGGLVTAGSATAAPAADRQTVTAAADVNPLAVNNLGLNNQQARNVQCFLKNGNWGYSGAIDGLMGTGTWQAMQRRLANGFGYNDAIDGIVGPNTIRALQRRLADGYGYTGAIDGIAGSGTQAAFRTYANSLSSTCSW